MRRRTRLKPKPFTDDTPGARELLARMMVNTSYRIPVEGTGTKAGLQSSDIAAAAGYMKDRIGRDVLIAVATRADKRAIAMITNRVYRRCAVAIRLMKAPRALDLKKAQDRWRLRVIVFDVLSEMVESEGRRRNLADMAKDAKMRKDTYTRAHHTVMAELQQTMNNAQTDFGKRLFGRGDQRGDPHE